MYITKGSKKYTYLIDTREKSPRIQNVFSQN